MQPAHAQFHFSPRPNKAHEIAWQAWGRGAFDRARAEDKPILLSISAVWCHWCHVMDETTYSDPRVIAAINERFVPVRVDNDRRPDVNARYNQGGWPTTAFLTPEGALLAGATYLPPDHLAQALDQIAAFYRDNREKIEERAGQLRSRVRSYDGASPSALEETIVSRVMDALEHAYDEEYAGFGDAPKFPMTDTLAFLLQEHAASGNERAYEMAARTVLAMSSGGMYDHVEGGFFRYSTTRDWSVPHFEKMTEDHAALIRILARLARTTRNDRFRSTLISAVGYVRAVLRDPKTGFFAGSQDADEQYYELPLEDRRKMQPPYVDRTSYSNWTAAMGAAFLAAGAVLEDDRLAAEGTATLDALHERMLDSNGLLMHFAEPGGEPQIRGLLTDQQAYLRALLDAHEYTGEPRFLERARHLADAILTAFSAPDGGFYDHASVEDSLGNLTVRDRPLSENAWLAESLLRLGALDGSRHYRKAAEAALTLYVNTFEAAGIFAAAYARAVRRYLLAETTVLFVGTPQQTAGLRETAHALPIAAPAFCTIDPHDRRALEVRGLSAGPVPAAYVCAGTVCGAPAQDAAALRDSYEQLLVPKGR